MLNRILIVLLAIFTMGLTACGGSSNNDTPPPVSEPEPEPQPEPEPEPQPEPEPEPQPEPEPEQEPNDRPMVPSDPDAIISYQFDTDEQASAFDIVVTKGASPELMTSAGKLRINGDWTDTDDQFGLELGFDQENFAGASMAMDVYFGEQFVSDGNLFVQFYLKDVNGRYANTTGGLSSASEASEKVGINSGISPSGKPGMWRVHLEDPIELDFVTEGFDISKVNRIGIEVSANGKSPDIFDFIYIDNLVIIPGPEVIPDPLVLSSGHDIIYRFNTNISGWTNDGSPAALSRDAAGGGALVITPNWGGGDEHTAYRLVGGSAQLSNATIEYIVSVTQAQIDGGLNLQPFIQQNAGSYTGDFSGWVSSESLQAGENRIIYEPGSVTDAVRIGIKAIGPITSGHGDPIIVKTIGITLDPAEQPAPAAASVNFESDTVGTSYSGMYWGAADLDASVVTITSVTGLPVNGSTNVLRVETGNYNAVPKVTLGVPAGEVLGDYEIHADIYFPVNTVGVTGNGDNGWKDVWMFAGSPLAGSAQNTNAGYQSTLPNADYLDQWHTYVFETTTVDANALTGSVEIAVGINRSASGFAEDVYYIDNIRLVAK